MSVTNCPHCTTPVPAAFASMPVCTICGGDLSASPSAPVWAAVDIRTDNTRTCHNCGEKIKSILAIECPACKVELTPAGKVVEDIEKEKANFEEMVKASNSKKEAEPAPVVETSKPEPKSSSSSTLKSNSSSSEIKPYPERQKEEKIEKENASVKLKDKKKQKEGFFAKLLRMLGLKKD